MWRFIIINIFFGAIAPVDLSAQNSQADSLRSLLKSANDTMVLDLYGRLAWIYLAPRVELEIGKAYADTLQEKANQMQNEKWKLRANYYYSAYERFKGNHSASVDYLLPYLKYYTALGDSNWVADGLFQLANDYIQLGDYPESIAALLRIIAIDKSLNLPRNVAHSLNSLGSAYFESRRYEDAINTYNEALSIYDSLQMEGNKATVFVNLGNVYTEIKDFNRAKIFYQQALALDRKFGRDYGVATDLANIAYVFDGMSQYDSGLVYHVRALKIREKLPDKHYLARSLVGVAIGNRLIGNYKQSEKYFMEALKTSQQIGSKPIKRDIYAGLAELYAVNKDYEKAYAFRTLHEQMQDSVLNEESASQINQLSARYQNEKKNHEIATLVKEKELQSEQAKSESFQKKAWSGVAVLALLSALAIVYAARQRIKNEKRIAEHNDQLKDAKFRQQVTELELKALKAQINPHFFFNCMTSINRMIRDGDSDNASRYLTKFSKLVRTVLETSDNDQVSVAQELDMLETYVQLEELRMKKKIDYDVFVDEKIERKTTFLPPMILQPFVENAIWHGIMTNSGIENGQIKVVIMADGQNLKCSIEDNGVGRERAKTMEAHDSWKTKSMGMKITEERLRLFNKEQTTELIHITDLKKEDTPSGTRVDIRIPVV